MDKKKILIIDDEEFFCGLIKQHLEGIGDFTVDIALSGRDGIHLSRKVKPDIIILDVVMPGMDGFEVLEKLKKDMETIKIPVIMLSAKDNEAFKERAAQLYDEVYLTKPVDAHDLKAKIDEILKRMGRTA